MSWCCVVKVSTAHVGREMKVGRHLHAMLHYGNQTGRRKKVRQRFLQMTLKNKYNFSSS
jgi:hypothetical protein